MQEVIEVSKKYFPSMACGFDNPELCVHNRDGAEFMSSKQEAFDIIITDSSDPIGKCTGGGGICEICCPLKICNSAKTRVLFPFAHFRR